jgi:hypothetical protein
LSSIALAYPSTATTLNRAAAVATAAAARKLLKTSNENQLIMSRASASAQTISSQTIPSHKENTYSLIDPNKIHLFVKAGQDGRSQGACPFCQDVFIQLLIKAQTNKFNFDVITINLDNPPKEFKELSIKVTYDSVDNELLV